MVDILHAYLLWIIAVLVTWNIAQLVIFLRHLRRIGH